MPRLENPAVDKSGNAFDKSSRRRDCLARGFGRDLGARAGFVVGNRFQIIGVGKERPQFNVNAGVVFHQPRKLALHAAVGLGILPVLSKIKACAACMAAKYAVRPASSFKFTRSIVSA